MTLQIIGYIVLFAILGVPFMGWAWRNLVEFGRYIYRSFPFLQKFFDEYFEHYAIGTLLCVIIAVIWAILHFAFGLV